MPNPRTTRYGHSEERPWEGAAKWVKVPDRDDVAEVVQAGKNMGSGHNSVYAYVLHFRSTGEVRFYAVDKVTRCDEHGNTEKP